MSRTERVHRRRRRACVHAYCVRQRGPDYDDNGHSSSATPRHTHADTKIRIHERAATHGTSNSNRDVNSDTDTAGAKLNEDHTDTHEPHDGRRLRRHGTVGLPAETKHLFTPPRRQRYARRGEKSSRFFYYVFCFFICLSRKFLTDIFTSTYIFIWILFIYTRSAKHGTYVIIAIVEKKNKTGRAIVSRKTFTISTRTRRNLKPIRLL